MPTPNEVLYNSARHNLGVFLPLVYRTDTGRPAIPPRHSLEYFIPALQANQHTVVVAPPGSAKTLTTMAACAWWLGNDPTQHIGYVTNTTFQARQRSVAIRDVIQSANYRAIFPSIAPDKSKGWSEDDWFLQRLDIADKDPSFTAAGVGSPILRARFDRIVLDDIADEENMSTEAQREKVRTWLNRTLMSRLTPNGTAVMICTRWAEDDPAQWAIERGWKLVHFPALSDNNESYWPEHWPIESLLARKNETDARSFALMYQGVVVNEESAIFPRNKWHYGLPPEDKDLIGGTFIDMAHTTKDSGDYSVLLTAVTDRLNLYVLDCQRLRVEYPELEEAVILTREARGFPIYVEDTPGTKPLIQRLRRALPGVLPLSLRGRDKVSRARAASPYQHAGNVYLPKYAPWTQDFIEELAVFPHGKHDDQVDAFSLCASTLMTNRLTLPKPAEMDYGITSVTQSRWMQALPEHVREQLSHGQREYQTVT